MRRWYRYCRVAANALYIVLFRGRVFGRRNVCMARTACFSFDFQRVTVVAGQAGLKTLNVHIAAVVRLPVELVGAFRILSEEGSSGCKVVRV